MRDIESFRLHKRQRIRKRDNGIIVCTHVSDQPITQLLRRVAEGEKVAEDALFSAVYDELRHLAGWFLRAERPGHTLQPTELVNEVYLRMLGNLQQSWNDRAHFFRVASKVMRQILVDYARKRNADKRRNVGDSIKFIGSPRISEDDLPLVLAIDNALKTLEQRDPRQAHIVEMRFFGGLTEEEIGLITGISSRTVKRDWTVAKAWLKAELDANSPRPSSR